MGHRGSKKTKKTSGNFLFGLGWREKIKRRDGRFRVRHHFYWRRVFVLFLALGLIGWFSGGAALYFYFKIHRGYEEVSYFKMLVLPLRMDEHRKEMGEFFLERGKRQFVEKDFSAGLHHLRAGLARSPADAEARMLLAGVFARGLDDPDRAVRILEDGLRFRDEDPGFLEREYLDFLIYLLKEQGRYGEIGKMINSVMDSIDDPALRSLLAFRAVSAELDAGQWTEAYRRLTENGLQTTPQGLRILSEILWSLGSDRLAILTLQRGVGRFPDSEPLLARLYSKLSEMGNWEEIKALTALKTKSKPDSFASWSWHLVALEKTGESDRILPVVREILERFPDRRAPIELLAFASEYGYPEVAEVVTERMDGSQSVYLRNMFLGLAFLRGGSPDKAIQLLGRSDDETEVAEKGYRIAGVRALALFELGEFDSAETDLQEFFQGSEQSEADFVVLGKAFAETGRTEQAIRIFKKGIDAFPQSQNLYVELLEVGEGRIGNAEYVGYMKRYLDRHPPRLPFLRDVSEILASDRFIFVKDQAELLEEIHERIRRGEELSRSLNSVGLGSKLSRRSSPNTGNTNLQTQ